MNSQQREQSPHPRDKGKARQSNSYIDQEPTETSPLLASRSYPLHPDNDSLETASHSNRSLLSTLTTVFLITLSISILCQSIATVKRRRFKQWPRVPRPGCYRRTQRVHA